MHMLRQSAFEARERAKGLQAKVSRRLAASAELVRRSRRYLTP